MRDYQRAMRVHAMLLLALLLEPRGPTQELQWSEQPFYPRLDQHAAAFDSWRNRLVVFGGLDDNRILRDETWEWDGATWTRRDTDVRPSARARAAMAFDPVRGRTVLFGSSSESKPASDVWEWDGQAWERRRFTVGPNGASRCGLVWSRLSNSILTVTPSNPLATWSYDGNGWTKLLTYRTPPSTEDLTLGFDERPGHLGAVLRVAHQTWVWDGTDWSKALDYGGPPEGGYLRMAFDAMANQLIAVHRSAIFPGALTVWSWSGAQWVERSNQTSLSLQGSFVLAQGPRRALTLDGGLWAYAGTATGTWEWKGDRWERAGGSAAPQLAYNRVVPYHQAAATDLRRRSVLLLDSSLSALIGQLWEWRERTWRLLDARVQIRAGNLGCLARDEARDRLIAIVRGYPNAELREWDGLSWTTRAFVPFATSGAYVPSTGKVLFVSSDGLLPAETWTWDGTDIELHHTAQKPPAIAVAHDPVRGQTILIARGESSYETWRWSGSDWVRLAPKTQLVRSGWGTAMTFDGSRGRLVLFEYGGRGEALWSWNGVDWIPESLAAPRPMLPAPSLSWDPGSGRLLVQGGSPFGTPSTPTSTWLLTTTAAQSQSTGSPCGGVKGSGLISSQKPLLGRDTALELATTRAFAPSAFLLGAAGADLPLGPCRLHVDPAQPLFVVPALTDVHGLAQLPLPIPYDLALRGLVVHTQALVEDPLVPFTRIATSAGLALRIGD